MTADQRLDQLEPLVSQTLAVADRHTAQLKQIIGITTQLLEAGSVQSDNMQFVLREMGELKQDVNREISGVKKEVQDMKEEVSQAQSMTNLRLGVMENSILVVGAKVTDLDIKLDRILGLLDAGK